MYEQTIVNKSPDESADDKNVWLFNIRDDPFEHMDLSGHKTGYRQISPG